MKGACGEESWWFMKLVVNDELVVRDASYELELIASGACFAWSLSSMQLDVQGARRAWSLFCMEPVVHEAHLE